MGRTVSRLPNEAAAARPVIALTEPFFSQFGQLASQGDGERSTMLQDRSLFTHTEAGRTKYIITPAICPLPGGLPVTCVAVHLYRGSGGTLARDVGTDSLVRQLIRGFEERLLSYARREREPTGAHARARGVSFLQLAWTSGRGRGRTRAPARPSLQEGYVRSACGCRKGP